VRRSFGSRSPEPSIAPDSTVLETLADEIALPGGRDLRAILVSSGTHEGTEVHASTEVAFNVSRNEEGVSGEE
jgi:hypothetical protein